MYAQGPVQPDLTALTNAFQKVFVFLYRPNIQLQLLIALALCLFAWVVIERVVNPLGMRWLGKRYLMTMSATRSMRLSLPVLLADAIIQPLLPIVLLFAATLVLQSAGLTYGLLSRFIEALWLILLFRVLIACLYRAFDPSKVRRYYVRLLVPLLVVTLFLGAAANITNLTVLSQVVLLNLFENPVTLGALFTATVGLYLWINFVIALKDVLQAFFTHRMRADPGTTQATLTLVGYALIIAGVAYVLSQLRLQSTTIAALTAGLTVGIGFGLQEVFSNLVSGILILSERSLRPGDVIEMGGGVATIQKVSIRSTTVKTPLNMDMVVPNRVFLTAPFTNYTATDRLVKTVIPVTVAVTSNPTQVKDTLLTIANQNPRVLKSPAPTVNLFDYTLTNLVFRLTVAVADPMDITDVRSDLYCAIWDAFDQSQLKKP